jgi:hypothetical protein
LFNQLSPARSVGGGLVQLSLVSGDVSGGRSQPSFLGLKISSATSAMSASSASCAAAFTAKQR